jgi:HSF-type DNA-binding
MKQQRRQTLWCHHSLSCLTSSQLLDILTNPENTDMIAWLPHGNGFMIHKKKTFANDVLPKYFKASKFTSFTRKLNRWGFTRVPRGPETGAYFHKLFRRDKPELCLQMTSNSGNKYQGSMPQQQLLPNVPGMMPNMGGMPGMFPWGNPMMASMTPQQQQAMWQQQMQQMMQIQQMQMMQMQHGSRPPIQGQEMTGSGSTQVEAGDGAGPKPATPKMEIAEEEV